MRAAPGLSRFWRTGSVKSAVSASRTRGYVTRATLVSGEGRDDGIAVGGQGLGGLVVHQGDSNLVGPDRGQLAQPVQVRLSRAEQAEPVHDGIRHEVRGRVVRLAVMGVVVALAALDVVG